MIARRDIDHTVTRLAGRGGRARRPFFKSLGLASKGNSPSPSPAWLRGAEGKDRVTIFDSAARANFGSDGASHDGIGNVPLCSCTFARSRLERLFTSVARESRALPLAFKTANGDESCTSSPSSLCLPSRVCTVHRASYVHLPRVFRETLSPEP